MVMLDIAVLPELSAFLYFTCVGFPLIAGLCGAWQTHKHRLRKDGIWKAFAVLTIIAFIGIVLGATAIVQHAFDYDHYFWRLTIWATLSAGIAWFLLPLMVGSICLYKANKFRKQQNSKYKIYFVVGAPLTFIVPAIGLLITWMVIPPTIVTCYLPVIENWDNFYSSAALAGVLVKRKILLTKIYKEKKINKDIYEKIKRTLPG